MSTILIIEDDPPILDLYQMALSNAGYNIITANNGVDGVELAEKIQPDLILCDINIPGMDGTNVLRVLRENIEVKTKQIVLMTGNAEFMDSRVAMEAGADDFLIKPFGVGVLLRCVESRLQRAQIHWKVENKAIKELRKGLKSTLPHEFFTPIAGILGIVDVLREDVYTQPKEEINELLDHLQQSSWRLHRTLKNYLFILDLDQSKDSPAENPIVQLRPDETEYAIRDGIVAVMRRQKRQDDLSISIESCPILFSVPDLAVIAEELLDNACSFSKEGSPISLTLSSDGVLKVNDSGRGLSEEQIEEIGLFKQFDRKQYEQQGLGLGLLLVKKLTRKYSAEFSLQSKPEKGTTATVVFKHSMNSLEKLDQTK